MNTFTIQTLIATKFIIEKSIQLLWVIQKHKEIKLKESIKIDFGFLLFYKKDSTPLSFLHPKISKPTLQDLL